MTRAARELINHMQMHLHQNPQANVTIVFRTKQNFTAPIKESFENALCCFRNTIIAASKLVLLRF